MIPSDFKKDFMNLTKPEEWEELRKKYKNHKIKLSDFDSEMREHFNELLKELASRRKYKGGPNIHVDIPKK